MPFGCGPRGEAQSILQGFPQVWVVVNLVSPSLFMVSPSTKSAQIIHYLTCCLVFADPRE
jgi:hypothetical protein